MKGTLFSYAAIGFIEEKKRQTKKKTGKQRNEQYRKRDEKIENRKGEK